MLYFVANYSNNRADENYLTAVLIFPAPASVSTGSLL